MSETTWLDIASIVLRKQHIERNALQWLTKLARSIKRPCDMDIGDLISYGMEGMKQASDRFDPLRGVQYTTYAESRVIGAMVSGIRNEWGAVNYRRDGEILFSELSDDEMDPRTENPDEAVLMSEIADIVRTLPTVERNVIDYVFMDGYSQRAVARIMSCSPQWVSIVKNRALGRIRLRLKQKVNPLMR